MVTSKPFCFLGPYLSNIHHRIWATSLGHEGIHGLFCHQEHSDPSVLCCHVWLWCHFGQSLYRVPCLGLWSFSNQGLSLCPGFLLSARAMWITGISLGTLKHSSFQGLCHNKEHADLGVWCCHLEPWRHSDTGHCQEPCLNPLPWGGVYSSSYHQGFCGCLGNGQAPC